MSTDPNNQAGSSATVAGLMGVYNSAKEKWDSSGGNEALNRVSASIPESTKAYVGGMFKREHFRGPAVFFGIGEERPFYVEKTPSLLMERLRHNMVFFYLNYFVLTGILFCLTLLVSPSAIIGIGLLALAWMWVIRSSQDGTFRLGSISVPQKTAVLIMGVISVFVLMYLLSGIFWWTLFSSGFLIAVHAFLRDASMHKDMDDAVPMEGDFNIGEESSFLGNDGAGTV